MFLQPKKFKKFKRLKKGKLKRIKTTSTELKFGILGLKSKQSGIISARQIETARQTITRKIKRNGKVWIRIFPDLPITSKSKGARMGSGKGSMSYWAVRVQVGTVLFELTHGVKESIAYSALESGGYKLPVKTLVFR